MKKILNYKISETSLSIIINAIRTRIFKYISKNSMPVFVKGGDILSIFPQTQGGYERNLINIINKINKDYSYNDFFFDVGANIGLVSCQCADNFKETYMFEPNKDCFEVLNVNTRLILKKTKIHSFNFGLGKEQKIVNLNIPKSNWGGAFINDKFNSYNKKILAAKDGYIKFEQKNYLKKKILLKSTRIILGKILKNLERRKLKRGIVKIDVEGYELIILKEISKILPKNIKLFIIFESWSPKFNVQKIHNFFNRKVKIYKILRKQPWKDNWPDVVKGISMILKGKIVTKVIDSNNNEWSGNIIIQV